MHHRWKFVDDTKSALSHRLHHRQCRRKKNDPRRGQVCLFFKTPAEDVRGEGGPLWRLGDCLCIFRLSWGCEPLSNPALFEPHLAGCMDGSQTCIRGRAARACPMSVVDRACCLCLSVLSLQPYSTMRSAPLAIRVVTRLRTGKHQFGICNGCIRVCPRLTRGERGNG